MPFESVMNEINRSLGRVEGKLDQLIETLNTHTNSDEENFQRIAARVSATERKIDWAMGVWATCSFLIAGFFAYIKF